MEGLAADGFCSHFESALADGSVWEKMMFLISLAGAAVCTFIATRGRRSIGSERYRRRLTYKIFFGNLVAFLTINYLDPPHYADSFFGIGGRFLLLLWVSLIYQYLSDEELSPEVAGERKLTEERRAWYAMKPRFILAWVLLVVYCFEGAACCPSFLPVTYSSLIGSVEKKESFDEFSIDSSDQITLVSKADAQDIGDRLAKSYAVSYNCPLYSFELQNVGGALFWVAPFVPDSDQEERKGVPSLGLVLVDAKNPESPPEMKSRNSRGEKLNFRFSPWSCLDEQLSRHIWFSGYTEFAVSDAHLEFDDAMDPYWIASLTQPSARVSGEKIRKVLVINPSSGEIDPYTLEDLPSWVDRVVPQKMALDSIKYWVEFPVGWTWLDMFSSSSGRSLSIDGHVNMGEMSHVYRPDGSAVWLVGVSRPNASDSSRGLSSIVSIDARSGKATAYSISGRSEIDAIAAANEASDVFRDCQKGYPSPACVNGKAFWVVPFISANMKLRSVALVEIDGERVFLGDSLEEAARHVREASGN